jgi:uncharacterized protein YcfJ
MEGQIMKKAVFCIAKSEGVAKDIVEKLKVMGFTADDISVLFADRKGTKDFAYEQHTKAPEGATTGGVLGAGAGGVLGWLAGVGTLAIPGIGPFLAAGPIMVALAGAAIGGATGGLIGALVGMGIPEFEAKRYEGKLRGGSILISVHTEDAKERARAKDVFELAGAGDISSTTETAVPKETAQRDKNVRGSVRRANLQDDRIAPTIDAGQAAVSMRGHVISDDDADFRAHWQSHYADSGNRYVDYAPAYGYGCELRRSWHYAGRTWDEIEPEARRDWELRYPGNAWERFKDSVRYGWERLTGATGARRTSVDRAGRHPAA